MATEILNIQQVGVSGRVPTFEAADATGNYVNLSEVDQKFVLAVFKNGGVSDIIVTIQTPDTAEGGRAVADQTVTVPASGEVYVSDLVRRFFGTIVNFTYSAVASLTVGVFELQRT